MAATEQKSQKGMFEELDELRQLAQDYDDDVREKLKDARKSLDERNSVLSRIQEITSSAMNTTVEDELANTPSEKPAARPGPKPAAAGAKRGPKPAASVTPKHNAVAPKPATSVTPKPNAVVPKPATSVTPKPNTVAPKPSPQPAHPPAATKNGSQATMTAPQAVWDALDREPVTYTAVVEGYPDDDLGLKTSEVKEVLEFEKKWSPTGANASPEIQEVIYEFRHEGKLGRNETTKRYFIIAGAELTGPPLNADGSAMTEMDDGTFQNAQGETFLWPDKSVYYGRDENGMKKTAPVAVEGESEEEGEQQAEE
jgi:hypothetical protein